MLKAVDNLCGVCWTWSSMYMFFLYSGAQNWTQHSRYISLGVNRGKITSLDLLVVFFIMKLRVPLVAFAARICCWLVFSLLLKRSHRSCSANLLSSKLAPVCTGILSYFFLGAGLCIYLFWTCWNSALFWLILLIIYPVFTALIGHLSGSYFISLSVLRLW